MKALQYFSSLPPNELPDWLSASNAAFLRVDSIDNADMVIGLDNLPELISSSLHPKCFVQLMSPEKSKSEALFWIQPGVDAEKVKHFQEFQRLWQHHGSNYHVLLEQTLSDLAEKNEALRKANFELDRFVYSASHDLRAPLTSVLGLIYLLKDESDDNVREKYLSLMIDSISKLDLTIRDIITYSKNNRTDVRMETLKLSKLMQPLIEQLNHFEGRGLSLKDSIRLQNDPEFVSDWSRLQIILFNLLSNAVKYRSPHRLLEIGINVEVSEATIKLAVKDNGMGISREYLPRIFDMFFRTNEKSTGAGLGLYVVKETVNKLKGAIQVNSNLNEGTEFIVILPHLPLSK